MPSITTKSSLRRLRVHAISQSLFQTTTLKSAINQLGFVRKRPRDIDFRSALKDEIRRLEIFLKLKDRI